MDHGKGLRHSFSYLCRENNDTKMKRFCFSLFLMFLVLELGAVPAEKKRMTVSLIQGGRIEVTFLGDENGYYYVTDDGFLVVPVRGTDCFELTDRTISESYKKVGYYRERAVGDMETGLPVAIPRTGSPKVPVILVSFADEDFLVPDSTMVPAQYYDLFCNGTRDGKNYTGAGSYGSVRDYFIAQSDSLLKLDFQVIGPVKLPHEAAYYGQDSLYADGSQEIDLNRSIFLNDVVSEAVQVHQDWDLFDNNGDGKVDMAFLIYAGLGQANGGESHTLWPREIVSETNVGGITFSVMAYCNQLRPIKDGAVVIASQTDGIGIMCHELSHALGLPDFYNQQHVTFGMDYWSVMDYGYFAMNGYVPGSYNAYERDFMGWRPLKVLDKPQTVRLYPIEEGGCGYKILNDKNPDEYYVLHNLQKSGWDTMLATLGHGMLVTHVDYDSVLWRRNQVNADPDHQRMTIIPANNSLKGNFNSESAAELLRSLAGNPYPGTTENTELTDETVPASVVYTGNFMEKQIKQIEEKDQVITFKFMPLGKLESVKTSSVHYDVSKKQLIWDAVPEATCYAVEVADHFLETPKVIWYADSVWGQEVNLDTLTGITATCKVRIKAMADQYEDSEYSDWISLDGTGILDQMSDLEERVCVYSLQGFCLYDHVFLKHVIDKLPKGVFLIRGKNTCQKLYIQH